MIVGETISHLTKEAASQLGKRVAVGAVSDAAQGNEVLADGEALKLAAIPIMDPLGLRLDVLVNNPILREHYAGFFGGVSSGTSLVAEHAHATGIRVSTGLGHFDVSLEDKSFLATLHLNQAIAHAFEPSIRAMEQLRLEQLQHSCPADKLDSLIRGHLPPGTLALCAPLNDIKYLAQFEQSCLHLLDEHGILVTAKRVDYLFGSQYVEGGAVNFPLVGGFTNVISKAELGVDVTAEDWVKLGGDAFLIACVTLVPVGTSVAAIAASGAIIGGVHGGLTQGALAYIRTGDAAQAMHAAGMATMRGATIGAVGGAVAGKTLQSLGTNVRGFLVSGSLSGGAVGATESTVRVLRDGASASGAVSDILTGTGKGALIGGVMGGAHIGISRLAGQFETIAESNAIVRRQDLNDFLAVEKSPEARLEAALQYAKRGEYFSSQHPGHIAKFESFVRELGPEPGVEQNLVRIGGANRDLGRGHYTELARAAHIKRAGKDIVAINQPADVPGLGKTDIDILCRNQNGGLEWHENKHVRVISQDARFIGRIDKMAAAREHALLVDVHGIPEPVRRVVFTNSGRISAPAIEYAKSKGVEIYDHRPYTRPA